ncbi:flagellar basal body P-ring formation chaperone FlgA [Pokkaliibacter sp. CJK22405]|uniref:flagellar basal body P-ring formation chaperone FlgA n=1 Tax=Pokkaliibacter sp. CJK22405 TaxID=3384615 RepID=UPI003984E42E
MQCSRWKKYCCLLLLCFLIQPSYGAVRSAQITQAVMNFIGQKLTQQGSFIQGRIDVDVDPIDPRLMFTDCAQPLTVEGKSDDWLGRVHIKVSCLNPKPWSIYVPVTIHLYQQVIVLNRRLQRGQAVTKGDLRFEERDVSGLQRQYFLDTKDVLGLSAIRHLSVNTVLAPSMLEPPVVIQRGDLITITAVSGSARISTRGVALEDGKVGESITVENASSKRKLQGRVIGPQEVEIN